MLTSCFWSVPFNSPLTSLQFAHSFPFSVDHDITIWYNDCISIAISIWPRASFDHFLHKIIHVRYSIFGWHSIEKRAYDCFCVICTTKKSKIWFVWYLPDEVSQAEKKQQCLKNCVKSAINVGLLKISSTYGTRSKQLTVERKIKWCWKYLHACSHDFVTYNIITV